MEIVKKVSDKEYGFKFTNLTIVKYCQLRGIEFHEFDEDRKNNFLASNNCMLRAAVDVYSKGTVQLSEYECDDLIEQMSQDEFNEVMGVYVQSMSSMLSKLTLAADSAAKKK